MPGDEREEYVSFLRQHTQPSQDQTRVDLSNRKRFLSTAESVYFSDDNSWASDLDEVLSTASSSDSSSLGPQQAKLAKTTTIPTPSLSLQAAAVSTSSLFRVPESGLIQKANPNVHLWPHKGQMLTNLPERARHHQFLHQEQQQHQHQINFSKGSHFSQNGCAPFGFVKQEPGQDAFLSYALNNGVTSDMDPSRNFESVSNLGSQPDFSSPSTLASAAAAGYYQPFHHHQQQQQQQQLMQQHHDSLMSANLFDPNKCQGFLNHALHQQAAASSGQGQGQGQSQGQGRKKSYPPVATTESCRVCGEPAAKHLHYGAITCFSCKAFFRRAIQNEVWSEFICRANNDCEIGLQSRKHCQKCRYDRCIKVGMKPGWVLSKVERQRRFNKRHVSSSDPVAGSPGPSSATSTSSSPSSYFKHQLSLSDPPEVMELVQVKEEAVSSPEGSQSDYKDDQTLPENAPSTDSGESVEAEGDDDDEVNDSAESVCSDLVLRSCGQDSVVQFFSSVYDTNYTSVNFGESLLKEMMMCSLFGVPISTSAAMSAYRLMIKRVTTVANGLDQFNRLSSRTKHSLLKENADVLVCLQGSSFFYGGMGGMEQLISSMGAQDLEKGRAMLQMIQVSPQTQEQQMRSIAYDKFNSIQRLDNAEMEEKFRKLMTRIGLVACRDPHIMKLLSFVLIFSTDSLSADLDPEELEKVEEFQSDLVRILQRMVFKCFGSREAVLQFSRLLACIPDLRELSFINMKRSFNQDAFETSEISSALSNA